MVASFGQRIKRHPWRTAAIIGLVMLLLFALYGLWQFTRLQSDTERVTQRLRNLQNIARSGLGDNGWQSRTALKTTIAQSDDEFKRLRQDWQTLQTDLKEQGWLLSLARVTPFGDRVRAIDGLSAAAPPLLELGEPGVALAYDMLDTLDRAPTTDPNNTKLGLNITTAQLDKIRANLTTIKTKLATAYQTIGRLDLEDFRFNPELYRAMSTAQTELPVVLRELDNSDQYLDTVGELFGLGEQPALYLALIQDTGETRPTGGFIGNYALLNIKQGRLDSYLFDNVYNLDDAYLDKNSLVAPDIYLRWWGLGERWGLRDVNLSPDFPETAQKAQELATLEGATDQPITAVAAINPGLIQGLLQLTGPIRLVDPTYGFDDTIDANNLVSKLHFYQLQVQVQADRQFYQRKAFTRLLAQSLIERLQALSSDQLIRVAKLGYEAIQKRDLLLYFNSPIAQSWLYRLNLSGQVTRPAQTPGDYLFSVEANTASNKTNMFVDVKAEDTLRFDSNRAAVHSLRLNYNYARPPNEYEGGSDPVFVTYNRLYLPETVTLQQRLGFGRGDGMVMQYGRQVWGQVVGIQPQQQATGQIDWTVPGQLVAQPQNTDLYRYHIQQQPGFKLDYRLKLVVPSGQQITAVRVNGQPQATAPAENGAVWLYQGILSQDLNIEVMLAN